MKIIFQSSQTNSAESRNPYINEIPCIVNKKKELNVKMSKTEQVKPPQVKISGPTSLVINDTEVTIQELIAEYEAEQLEGKKDIKVLEAKINLSVKNPYNSWNSEFKDFRNLLNQAVYEYMGLFKDFVVREIDLPYSITTEMNMLDDEFQTTIKKEIYLSKFSNSVIGRDFGTAVKMLMNIRNYKGETLIDKMSHVKLVKVPEDGEYDEKRENDFHVVHFGCDSDCEPMLNWSTREEDYQKFIDHFEQYEFNPKPQICTRNDIPETKWTSETKVLETRTQTGWVCH